MMKLQNEFENVKNKFKERLEDIKDYAPKLKESGDYNDFEVRLAWDCLRAFIGTKTLCNWYYKYDCNDKHITTLGKKVLKELGVI